MRNAISVVTDKKPVRWKYFVPRRYSSFCDFAATKCFGMFASDSTSAVTGCVADHPFDKHTIGKQ